MMILAFDSTSSILTVALFKDEQCLARRSVKERFSIEFILDLVQQILDEVQLDKHHIELIAINVGPGNLTSLRIGLTTARALSQFGHYALVGVNTFDVLMSAALQLQQSNSYWYTSKQNIFVVLDAKRKNIFIQHPLLTKNNIEECSPTKLIEYIRTDIYEDAKCLLIGSGALFYASQFKKVLADKILLPEEPYHIPDVGDVAKLGRIQFLNHGAIPLTELRPLYIRKEVI